MYFAQLSDGLCYVFWSWIWILGMMFYDDEFVVGFWIDIGLVGYSPGGGERFAFWNQWAFKDLSDETLGYKWGSCQVEVLVSNQYYLCIILAIEIGIKVNEFHMKKPQFYYY